jgi:hypothetical protein
MYLSVVEFREQMILTSALVLSGHNIDNFTLTTSGKNSPLVPLDSFVPDPPTVLTDGILFNEEKENEKEELIFRKRLSDAMTTNTTVRRICLWYQLLSEAVRERHRRE